MDERRRCTSGPLEVPRLGLGVMGLSAFYTSAGGAEAHHVRMIHRAMDLGVTMLDTAEVYCLRQRGAARRSSAGTPRSRGDRDQVVSTW
ncbi:aldo/keto reductase [Streptomyces tendae]|uniref:aldo/keto reductase n=1 Tax=Streptomyces tendae TaxID=1932 RepID=UPI0033E1368B